MNRRTFNVALGCARVTATIFVQAVSKHDWFAIESLTVAKRGAGVGRTLAHTPFKWPRDPHNLWTSMTIPMMISMSGHHCLRSGPSCGIQPRLDRRNSTPTIIKTSAPVRDLSGTFPPGSDGLIAASIRHAQPLLPRFKSARPPGQIQALR